MNQTTPAVHLKRAWGLLQDVDKNFESLRQHLVEHDAAIDQMGSAGDFFGSFVNLRRLKKEKSELVSDIELAAQEIARCASMDSQSTIEIDGGVIGVPQAMAAVYNMRGQVESTWGSADKAKHYFLESAKIAETPFSYFMLGFIHETQYKPTQAIEYYEKCLAVDPDGELSVPALRSSNKLKKYSKKFRGSWGVFLLLLIFFFPAAILYFALKWK